MSSTNQDSGKRLNIYGHVSATPQSYASALGGVVASTVDPECDVAIFAINPAAGIDNETIELWRSFDEYQTPRLVVVGVLEGVDMDFDDAVLLANRVFDLLVTPYLVLHGESGTPIGTISLEDLTTKDYSTNPRQKVMLTRNWPMWFLIFNQSTESRCLRWKKAHSRQDFSFRLFRSILQMDLVWIS